MSSPSAGRLGAILVVLALTGCLLIGGCSTTRAPDFTDGDGPPREAPDLSRIPNAEPRIEPRSRGGNPESYEVFGRRYRVMDSSSGFAERGTASWYGRKFHGRRTSNGEVYDMYQMTAAHKHLPLPTYVRVTNLDNRRSVVVRVNDRGPFHGGRIIDLSYVAAGKLGMLGKGTARVEIRAIDPRRPGATRVAGAPAPRPSATEPDPLRPVAPDRQTATTAAAASATPADATASSQGFFLQAGAFASEHNARQLQTRLSRDLERSVRVTPARAAAGPVYRVQVGPLNSIRHVDTLAAELERLGVSNPRVVID